MRIHGAAEGRAFIQELEAMRRGASLLQRTRHVLGHLLAHLRDEGVCDLRAVEERHLASFLRSPGMASALSQWTKSAYLGTVRCFFTYLVKRGRLLRNPAEDLPLEPGRRLPRRILSEGEARRLMGAPWPGGKVGLRDRAVFETLYGTGVRLRECTRLDIADLDLCQGTLLVRGGKGGKDRLVPLTKRATLALDLYLREARGAFLRDPRETALFLSQEARRLSPVTLGQRLKLHGRALLGRAVSPHDLRHACATHLLRGGADIRHVQEILGHESLETTALYTRVDVRDLRRVIERSHPRERRRRRRL